jgi:hypothetical protein
MILNLIRFLSLLLLITFTCFCALLEHDSTGMFFRNRLQNPKQQLAIFRPSISWAIKEFMLTKTGPVAGGHHGQIRCQLTGKGQYDLKMMGVNHLRGVHTWAGYLPGV